MKTYDNETARFVGYIRNINSDRFPRYMVKTFGCQMNESDSEKISGILEDMGYVKGDDEASCSFIIFNTCCVRESAEQKLFGHLGEMKKLKESNSGLIIAVCGCMMQQEGMAERVRRSYPYADIVFGANSMHLLPGLLYGVLTKHKRQIAVTGGAGDIIEGTPTRRDGSAKAYVPVMHGCDNFCSYCIVPYVRGREKSRVPSEIIKEISDLAGSGVREIMLLGQNVNSYDGGVTFARLLRMAGGVEGIKRIRFMTSHPKDMGDDLLETIRDTWNVCKQLHLPLQSGSSRVLGLMNRNYTRESYIGRLEKARDMVPGIGLSTDIIVGFPGETETDFQETLDVLEKIRFDFAFTFIYSKRSGTPAAEMTGEIPDQVKHDRFNRLLEVQNRITLERNMSNVGATEIVLTEGPSRTDHGMLTGRTDSNKIVNFAAPEAREGEFAEIRIVGARTWHLEGEFIGWK